MIIGKDIKKPNEVEFSSNSKSRVILITGKRGSGKSYTLGILAEELFEDNLILLVDPLGIFWTLCLPNPELDNSQGLPTTILVPGEPAKRYGSDIFEQKSQFGVEFRSLRLNPSAISPSGWCQLFDISISEPLGIALFRAVQSLAQQGYFTVEQLIEAVMEDFRAQDKTKQALINRLDMACSWDIFSEAYEDIWQRLKPNCINVLDLSVLEPGAYGLANLIVMVLIRDLFVKRIRAKQRENLGVNYSSMN